MNYENQILEGKELDKPTVAQLLENEKLKAEQVQNSEIAEKPNEPADENVKEDTEESDEN